MAEPRTSLPNGDNVTLRELFARLEGLRGLMDERDRRYEERFEAQETALAKADVKLTEYKETSNEWRGESKDRAAEYPTRNEVDAKLEGLRSEAVRIDKMVRDLRESGAGLAGMTSQSAASRAQNNQQVGWIIGGFGLLISVSSIGIGLALALSGR